MADDDDFEPRLGKIRIGGGKRARRYLSRVIAATHLAAGGRKTAARSSTFSGVRIGRGAGIGRLLAARGAGRRRVIVKASIVKLGGKGAPGAMAHLRYLQRDGTTREGDPGDAYDRREQSVDVRKFHARCESDRHQFRFIVSPEDGDQYEELKPLTRRLMERVEEDLGTRLDWVAVDHFNTGHPHTHVVVRGVDEGGKDLVIARDYLTRGLRERAVELVELDLGPPSYREILDRTRREVDQERLTSIDRALLRFSKDGREVVTASGDPVDQSLRAGRLAKLASMGLAEPLGRGQYRLAAGLEDTLQRMGERGDIIRTMQRAFGERRAEIAAADRMIYEPERENRPLVGRVMIRGLSDEHDDRHFLIVEGIDGRAHYVGIGQGDRHGLIAEGAVVEITSRPASPRATDHIVAEVAAANGGRYQIDLHLALDATASQTFAEMHERRLEALRRGGVAVERLPNGIWRIPPDFLARVTALEISQRRDRPVEISVLSSRPIEALIDAEAATWIDRELVSEAPLTPRDGGFGRDVRLAQERRRQWLVAQGLAEIQGDATRFRPGLLNELQRRELVRASSNFVAELRLPFSHVASGERIEGKLDRIVELVSGRFALVERSRDFVLVPWRPVLDRAIGKPVSGIMRDAGVNWAIGRSRSGPAI